MKTKKNKKPAVVAALIKEARNTLDELKPYLYGEEERSSDLYMCGAVDAEYDTWIKILDFLGEPHEYQLQV